MSDYNVYIPPTLHEVVKAIQKCIDDPESDIDGNENVIDAFLITKNNEEYPPCTLGLSLRRAGLTEEDTEYATMFVTPHKPTVFM